MSGKFTVKGLFTGCAAVAALGVWAFPAAAQNVEARAQSCAGCHGANGVPADPKSTPVIWGQTEAYIVKQLHNYKTGDRKNPLMEAIAKTIKVEEIRPLAKYFAAKTWPENQAKNASAAEPAGMTVCKTCHQPNFQGALPGPHLAGLSYEYLFAQMQQFTDGRRTNNEDMPKVMHEVSDNDRQAMAHYLAGL